MRHETPNQLEQQLLAVIPKESLDKLCTILLNALKKEMGETNLDPSLTATPDSFLKLIESPMFGLPKMIRLMADYIETEVGVKGQAPGADHLEKKVKYMNLLKQITLKVFTQYMDDSNREEVKRLIVAMNIATTFMTTTPSDPNAEMRYSAKQMIVGAVWPAANMIWGGRYPPVEFLTHELAESSGDAGTFGVYEMMALFNREEMAKIRKAVLTGGPRVQSPFNARTGRTEAFLDTWINAIPEAA